MRGVYSVNGSTVGKPDIIFHDSFLNCKIMLEQEHTFHKSLLSKTFYDSISSM